MTTTVPASQNPRGVTIHAVLWIFVMLAAVFLGLRVYCKLSRNRKLWWDDYFILVSWVLLLLSCISTTINVSLGFGIHSYLIPLENFGVLGILSNISGFASVLAVVSSKTSFAITLLRLTDGKMKMFVWFLIILLNVTHNLSAVFFWVSCDPPEKTWNPTVPGTCWPMKFTITFSYVVGSCSAFSDFALALLPWRLLLRYSMYQREKIGVAIAMSTGIIAGIACIVKLSYVHVFDTGDFSYDSLPLVIWGFAEPACTIIAASIPMLRPLFKGLGSTRPMPSGYVNASGSHPPTAVPESEPPPLATYELEEKADEENGGGKGMIDFSRANVARLVSMGGGRAQSHQG